MCKTYLHIPGDVSTFPVFFNDGTLTTTDSLCDLGAAICAFFARGIFHADLAEKTKHIRTQRAFPFFH